MNAPCECEYASSGRRLERLQLLLQPGRSLRSIPNDSYC